VSFNRFVFIVRCTTICFYTLGHSFGGYLTAAYALKHPERLKSAILADPWGMVDRPADIKQLFNIPFWVSSIFREPPHLIKAPT
jgi:pimeloyl-ACP methyl ester carboxylesterase